MILRRLAQSLKDQNWTAITIEFVLLVLGVFLGIQVSNWNESRHEAQRARGYLSRIHDDLSADLASLQRHRVFWQKVIGHGHDAIGYAETGTLVDGSAWKTLLAFYQASQLFPLITRDTTYQELRNAGELALITDESRKVLLDQLVSQRLVASVAQKGNLTVTDESLRAELALYYVTGPIAQADILLAGLPEYRKIVRGLTPSVASAQVWAHCHKAPVYDEQYLLDCESPMTEAEAQAVLDAYLAEPRLLPELRFWITNLEVAQSLFVLNEKATRDLVVRLPAASAR